MSEAGQRDEVEKKQNSTAWIYLKIKELILEKKLQPGEKINQITLSQEFQISRTPVVKALHKLETEGLIDAVPDRGFFVHVLTVKELLDLFALREALDTMILTGLAETIQDDQVEQLEDVLRIMEAIPTDNREAYWKEDGRFHALLLSFSQNSLARKINETFQVYGRTYMAGLLRSPEETYPEHRMIVNALRSRDVEAARLSGRLHVEKTGKLLQESVRNLQELNVDPSRIPVKDI